MADIITKIDNMIKENKVVLFMKGTKGVPQCGYSSVVSSLLSDMNVDFKCVNVLDDDDIRQGIKKYSNWPTIPQLYINQEFIGGHDIIVSYHRENALKNLFHNIAS